MSTEISVSDYIAAGSLLVAIVALVKSFLSDRKVKKLDVILKEKELQHHEADEEDMKKADVEVEVIETAPKKMNILRFYNIQNFEVPFYSDSRKPHQTIVITWDDEFAKGRSKEMIVDM